jgi:hypothetical protein
MFEPPGKPLQQSPGAASIPPVAGPPDWDSLTEQITCPMCTYNLRGLIEPRCPECGYRFTWPDMLDPRRRLHRYLFEHHPEKSIRSFLRTALAGWLPRRFWTSLHPFQPSNPGRLVRYWVYAISVYVLAVVASLLANAIVIANTNRIYQSYATPLAGTAGSLGSGLTTTYPSPSSQPAAPDPVLQGLQQMLQEMHPTSIPVILRDTLGRPFRRDRLYVTLALPIVWPWLTFATLMVFRFTMRRVGVKPIHALRCVLYSMDTPFWFGLLVIAISVGQIPVAVFASGVESPIVFFQAWPAVTLLLALIACWRMWRAYKYYMQFDHPLATVLVAQFIVLLVVVISLAASGADI